MDLAREQLNTRLSAQKEAAAGGVGTVAHVLQQVGEQLRQEDQAQVGQYVSSAASQVEQLADTLRTQDVDQLVETVGNYARRQPAAFLAAAFALGFAGARFFRSSTPPRRDRGTSGAWGGGGATQPWPGQSTGMGYGAANDVDYGTRSGMAGGTVGIMDEITTLGAGTAQAGGTFADLGGSASGFGGSRAIDGGAEMVDPDAAVRMDDLTLETKSAPGQMRDTGWRGAGGS